MRGYFDAEVYLVMDVAAAVGAYNLRNDAKGASYAEGHKEQYPTYC
jgi:hypothetical protein